MDECLEVKLDSNAIFIGNNPVFLFSSDFHYYLIPQKTWDNELKNIKKIGFNAISVYIPWIFHEIEEDKFDFKSENRNLKKLFDLCKKYQLYVYCRPGPRNSKIIQNSGYPLWLFEKYKEILDSSFSNKNPSKKNQKNQKKQKKQKTPLISFLHPKYLEKVKIWYKRIFSII